LFEDIHRISPTVVSESKSYLNLFGSVDGLKKAISNVSISASAFVPLLNDLSIAVDFAFIAM
jgi:hypothetical protein